MKSFFLLTVVFVTGCEFNMGGSLGSSVAPGAVEGGGCGVAAQTASADPAQCIAKGQVPIYSNRFSSGCGASSVVSGADAFANASSSDGSGAPSGEAPPSAMIVSCGDATCPAGQVGVMGVDPMSAGTIGCAAPPPPCAEGESPQYVSSSATWECTGCGVVITYGSTYGNYSRCASEPTIECPSGQVPTWDVTAEEWGCAPTCDNGDYDQHMLDGSTVCVPC